MALPALPLLAGALRVAGPLLARLAGSAAVRGAAGQALANPGTRKAILGGLRKASPRAFGAYKKAHRASKTPAGKMALEAGQELFKLYARPKAQGAAGSRGSGVSGKSALDAINLLREHAPHLLVPEWGGAKQEERSTVGAASEGVGAFQSFRHAARAPSWPEAFQHAREGVSRAGRAMGGLLRRPSPEVVEERQGWLEEDDSPKGLAGQTPPSPPPTSSQSRFPWGSWFAQPPPSTPQESRFAWGKSFEPQPEQPTATVIPVADEGPKLPHGQPVAPALPRGKILSEEPPLPRGKLIPEPPQTSKPRRSRAPNLGNATDLVGALRENTGAVRELTAAIHSMPLPQKFNQGGPVPGRGDQDTVPAMLTPGEWVLTKEQVKAIGESNLRQMPRKLNQGGPVQKFAGGGLVAQAGAQAVQEGFPATAELMEAFRSMRLVLLGPAGLVAATVKTHLALGRFSRELLRGAEGLKRWDSNIARNMARLEWGRLSREAQQARNTSGSTSTLAAARNEFEAEVQGFKNVGQSLLNTVGILVTRFQTNGVRLAKIATFFPLFEKLLGAIERNTGGTRDKLGPPMWEFLQDAAKAPIPQRGDFESKL